jgi:hypothetical protein
VRSGGEADLAHFRPAVRSPRYATTIIPFEAVAVDRQFGTIMSPGDIVGAAWGVRLWGDACAVPTISRFYGIVIRMYFSDHPPPHFHAVYADQEAVIAIASGAVLRGALPDRALRMVREWASIHRDELAANWERTQTPEQPAPIAPLP